MPGPKGPINLEVMIRSSRIAGRQVFEYLRRAGRGALYNTGGAGDDKIDSMGNLETIPPYSFKDKSFPAGRIIEGSHPKSCPTYPHVYDYMRAQEFQDPLVLDTDWLVVGHVDEIVQFLPANTPYGWALYIADPMAGIEILENAKKNHGDTPAFSRQNDTYTPKGLGDIPGLTITELLTDRLIGDNQRFAKKLDAILNVLQSETGISSQDVHHVPMVFTAGVCWGPDEEAPPDRNCSDKHAVALYPGVLNGVVLSNSTYLSPKPWGPLIDGTDIMEEATKKVYGEVGLEVVYIDDWYSHHEGGGEVHCGTNTVRIPNQPWWSTEPLESNGGRAGRKKLEVVVFGALITFALLSL
ncbi:hypothetical protein F5Y14DRAFT_433512 [Nemania sp. NC0429]|nr:hypothetical protein F5Y14DRAFT_433512 [Nemania sp. NC0429]